MVAKMTMGAIVFSRAMCRQVKHLSMKSSPGHQIAHPVVDVLVKLPVHNFEEIEYLKVRWGDSVNYFEHFTIDSSISVSRSINEWTTTFMKLSLCSFSPCLLSAPILFNTQQLY